MFFNLYLSSAKYAFLASSVSYTVSVCLFQRSYEPICRLCRQLKPNIEADSTVCAQFQPTKKLMPDQNRHEIQDLCFELTIGYLFFSKFLFSRSYQYLTEQRDLNRRIPCADRVKLGIFYQQKVFMYLL